MEESGPTSTLRQANREASAQVTPNPRWGRWPLPATPTSAAAAASFSPWAWSGGAAGLSLGCRRKDFRLNFLLNRGRGFLVLALEAGSLNCVLRLFLGMNFPLTVSQVKKLKT